MQLPGYDQLEDFLAHKMRMSHIYQPVMLMALLSKGGKCNEREIASELLARREPGCLFCEMKSERIVAENELAFAISDGYPVTPLHTLIIPRRHVSTFFELGQAEINACTFLVKNQKKLIETEDHSVDGFNIGMNNGVSAGQTINHCHIHLIPRRTGDVENPRGGVRHTIPGKGYY